VKKTIMLALAAVLAAGVMATPATAGKKAKPVMTTLYLHGNYPVGDGVEFVGSITDSTHMRMDANEPTDAAPKSMSFSLPVGNEQCVGNHLFPAWESTIAGTIIGDMKWTAHFAAPPAKATARLWVDVPFGSCTSAAAGVDAFVEPLRTVEVDIPAGHNEVEILFEDLKVPARANIVIQVHTRSATSQGRILYDSTSMASRVEFSCVPASGKSCV